MSDHIQTERWVLELRGDDKIELSGFGEGVHVLTVAEAIELRNALVAITSRFTLDQFEALILQYADGDGCTTSFLERGIGTGKTDDLIHKLFAEGFVFFGAFNRVFITDAGRKALASYRALRA